MFIASFRNFYNWNFKTEKKNIAFIFILLSMFVELELLKIQCVAKNEHLKLSNNGEQWRDRKLL